jgi:hypothetical protein
MAHQLQAIMLAPAQIIASLAAPPEGAARAEPGAYPACRLHARVSRLLKKYLFGRALVS